MKVIGTLAEVLHLFDAMKGNCEGCPARTMCRLQDELEDKQNMPEATRSSCKDMLARVVEVELEDKRRTALYGDGVPIESAEETT